jgi:hypothetical protein
MQKRQKWQIRSGRALQTAGCASTYKIVYWYSSLNIFGYQLLDN